MLKVTQIQMLKKQEEIRFLSLRKERYEYLGLLDIYTYIGTYQLQPETVIQKLDYTKLNPHQHFLFKRVLHGLNMYTQPELAELHWDKKRRIKKIWQKAQSEINIWKQIICAKRANQVFEKFTKNPNCKWKSLLTIPVDETDPEYVNTLSLKELGLKYDDLILFFIQKGFLPKNFLCLAP
jgi:hypothetical protein